MSLKNKTFANISILLVFLSFLVFSLSFAYAQKSFIIQNATTGNYLFVVNGTTGFVGIGLVNPSYPLHVVGNAYFANDIICSGCIHSSDIANNAVGLSQLASISCPEGSAIRVLGNGQLVCVQINTTQGVINGSGIVNYIPVFTGVSTIGASPFYLTSNNLNLGRQSLINASWVNASYLNVSAGLVVLPSGNVGVGTTSPVKKLDVVGDINATGAVYSVSGYYVGVNQIITGARVLQNIASISQSLLPTADNTYDLGSSSLRWRNAYFSGTIYGNVQGTITPTGNINMNGYSIYNAYDVNATRIFQGGNRVVDTVIAGNGLIGGGSGPSVTLDVNVNTAKGLQIVSDALETKIGTGLSYDASGNIYVVYGSTAGTAAEGNKQITISAGTGLSGGGTVTIGSGGSVSLGINTAIVPRKDVADTINAPWTFAENVRFNKNVFIAGNLSYVNVNTLNVNGSMIPIFDNQFNLGNSSNRWANVYAVNVYASNINGGTPITGSGSTNYVAKFTGSNTIGNSIIYDTGTNVGIGTISPLDKLDVRGNRGLVHISGNTYNVDGWGKYAVVGEIARGGTWPTYIPAGSVGLEVNWDSDALFVGVRDYGANRKDAVIAWGDDSADNLRIQFNGADRILITSAGNVGIGTTTPQNRLHVSGGEGRIISEGTWPGVWMWSTQTANRAFVGSASANNDIGFWTSGVGWGLVMLQNGNVGIGTTTPSSKLEIASVTNWWGIGLGTDGNKHFLIGRGNNLAERRLTLHIPNAAQYGGGAQPQLQVVSSGDVRLLTVEADTGNTYIRGNVGIGTTTPAGKLSVFMGSDWGSVHIGGSNPDLWFDGGSDSVFWISNRGASSGRTSITYGNTELFTVLNSGNVGIGTTNPGEKLEVSGNIKLSGYVNVAGSYIRKSGSSIVISDV